MKIPIDTFEEVFSRYFATEQQKEELKYIAKTYDTNNDEELEYTEYKEMKEHLKVERNDLYRDEVLALLASLKSGVKKPKLTRGNKSKQYSVECTPGFLSQYRRRTSFSRCLQSSQPSFSCSCTSSKLCITTSTKVTTR